MPYLLQLGTFTLLLQISSIPGYSLDIDHHNFEAINSMRQITNLDQSLDMAYEGKFDLAGSLRSSQSLSSNAAK